MSRIPGIAEPQTESWDRLPGGVRGQVRAAKWRKGVRSFIPSRDHGEQEGVKKLLVHGEEGKARAKAWVLGSKGLWMPHQRGRTLELIWLESQTWVPISFQIKFKRIWPHLKVCCHLIPTILPPPSILGGFVYAGPEVSMYISLFNYFLDTWNKMIAMFIP